MGRRYGVFFECDAGDGVTEFVEKQVVNIPEIAGQVERTVLSPAGWNVVQISAPPGEERMQFFHSDACAGEFFEIRESKRQDGRQGGRSAVLLEEIVPE